MTLSELRQQVMEAKGPSRELDACLWRFFNEDFHDMAPSVDGWLVGGNHAQPIKSPELSASVDACLALVERKLPGSPFDEILTEALLLLDRKWPCRSDGAPMKLTEALPLAILAALLTALEKEERDE